MKCPVCSAEATAGASFCQHCGAKLPLMDANPNAKAPPNPLGTSSPSAPPTPQADPADVAPGAALTGRRRPGTDVPEEEIWQGSYSPKAMLGPLVGGVIASLALFVLAVLFRNSAMWIAMLALVGLLWLAIGLRLANKRLGIHYRLTNQMFYHRKGVLTRQTNRVEAIDIDDVTYQQSLFDRMVNVGTITISSSDRSDPLLKVEGVENVQEVAEKIDKARRAERIRRGVSVEAV